jgi:4-carboxymuconolactone decarboxylase
MPAVWGDELLLQSRLMVGYPRTLSAAGWWREAIGRSAAEPEPTSSAGVHSIRGEATCRQVYGANYEKLRDNVRRLHPSLDAWMVAEGYGATIGRPGLDLVRRELAVIAQVAALEAARQLHSHLRGALNVGATGEQIDAVFVAIADDLTPRALATALERWNGMR